MSAISKKKESAFKLFGNMEKTVKDIIYQSDSVSEVKKSIGALSLSESEKAEAKEAINCLISAWEEKLKAEMDKDEPKDVTDISRQLRFLTVAKENLI